MDGISGSTDSLVSLGMAMGDARLRNEMSVSALKKGLDAQAQAALNLIETVQVQPTRANSGQTGQLIDVVG